jgi:hypothetical protein
MNSFQRVDPSDGITGPRSSVSFGTPAGDFLGIAVSVVIRDLNR